MKLVSLMCPHCGARLSVDMDRSKAFCQYCGAQLFIDDENTTININQRIIDEARLKEAEVRLKELEYEHEISSAYNKERKSWGLMLLIYIIALAVSITVFQSSSIFGYIFIFGGLAVWFLKPKGRYAFERQTYYSSKSRGVALVLCLFFGIFGIHYFYVGRPGMGILYLLTFGIGGIGWLIDILRILFGFFRDAQDRPLR